MHFLLSRQDELLNRVKSYMWQTAPGIDRLVDVSNLSPQHRVRLISYVPLTSLKTKHLHVACVKYSFKMLKHLLESKSAPNAIQLFSLFWRMGHSLTQLQIVVNCFIPSYLGMKKTDGNLSEVICANANVRGGFDSLAAGTTTTFISIKQNK